MSKTSPSQRLFGDTLAKSSDKMLKLKNEENSQASFKNFHNALEKKVEVDPRTFLRREKTFDISLTQNKLNKEIKPNLSPQFQRKNNQATQNRNKNNFVSNFSNKPQSNQNDSSKRKIESTDKMKIKNTSIYERNKVLKDANSNSESLKRSINLVTQRSFEQARKESVLKGNIIETKIRKDIQQETSHCDQLKDNEREEDKTQNEIIDKFTENIFKIIFPGSPQINGNKTIELLRSI